MAAAKDVRITDPYMIARIDAARIAAGEKSSTKTAARLIIERLAQMELIQSVQPSAYGTRPISGSDARSAGMTVASM